MLKGGLLVGLAVVAHVTGEINGRFQVNPAFAAAAVEVEVAGALHGLNALGADPLDGFRVAGTHDDVALAVERLAGAILMAEGIDPDSEPLAVLAEELHRKLTVAIHRVGEGVHEVHLAGTTFQVDNVLLFMSVHTNTS